MMAERYRRQKDGLQDDPLTDDAGKANSYREVPGVGGKSVWVRKSSDAGPPKAEEYYSASMADPGQVMMLEREIAKLREELDRTAGFNPATGEPRYVHQGEARRLRELQLEHLENFELPAVRELQRVAAEWRAKNVPTAEAKLLAEKERRETVRQRAEEIAAEREAQEQAERIIAERRNQRS